jgi:hypothetical protein
MRRTVKHQTVDANFTNDREFLIARFSPSNPDDQAGNLTLLR